MADFLTEIRDYPNLKNAIIGSIVLSKDSKCVCLKLITDKSFTENDRKSAHAILRKYVPKSLGCELDIIKLAPDCDMVKAKIMEAVSKNFKALFVTLSEKDVTVLKGEGCFYFTLKVMPSTLVSGVCDRITEYLKKHFCGEFFGKCEVGEKSANDLIIEEDHENIEFEVPVRNFDICDFHFLEGTEKQNRAVYISDLNFESENVVICGSIEDIRERAYTNKRGQDKTYYNFTISDTTAMIRVTYFTRQKSIEKIKALKIGDSIVCTCKSEFYNGNLRITANFIDFGKIPEGFVPEKRKSKPVPKYFSYVSPEPFSDITQTDMFTENFLPQCLKEQTFVVFDLETTGLNSSPTSGNMDKIIEIGAFKVSGGAITERFCTFINPEKKLSEEIINLTGITDEMLKDAPTYEQVMPDFFKFCSGSILVGHNIVGFDYKFVDYYCARLGYMLERRIIDTLSLSQELLFLSNYKLNTIADKFGITFNHHRASDDAYVTARIFIELIKIKKSLPKLQ